jgi:hypothetical protein
LPNVLAQMHAWSIPGSLYISSCDNNSAVGLDYIYRGRHWTTRFLTASSCYKVLCEAYTVFGNETVDHHQYVLLYVRWLCSKEIPLSWGNKQSGRWQLDRKPELKYSLHVPTLPLPALRIHSPNPNLPSRILSAEASLHRSGILDKHLRHLRGIGAIGLREQNCPGSIFFCLVNLLAICLASSSNSRKSTMTMAISCILAFGPGDGRAVTDSNRLHSQFTVSVFSSCVVFVGCVFVLERTRIPIMWGW